MSEQPEQVYLGEIVTHGCRERVYGCLGRDGCLYLRRKRVDNVYEVDDPTTLVTREGLLRLSQGPFEKGFVEDHL